MLIVDDSSELCSILLLTFSYESFEILQAEKGLQSIALAEHENPEVIIRIHDAAHGRLRGVQKDKGDTSVN
jgi:DNA-binding response OmpR family regulator